MEGTVAFTVALDGHYSPAIGEKIPYNNVITNIGNGYITQRDEFICPLAGTYVFNAALIATGLDDCYVYFYRNEEQIGQVFSRASALVHGSNMFLLELSEADTVSMRAASSCTVHGSNNFSTFSGFRMD